MNVFDRRYEMMPRSELEQLQLERLQALLARLRRNVRRYREKLGDLRLESLEDLHRLPFTTPEEMAESFPYGMFAFPLRDVIRLHTSIGPAGKPLVIGHTRNDLVQWGRLVARQLVASGVTSHDVVQVSLGSGAHLGASGYVLGAELIEASVIAEDPLHLDYQVAMLQNYRPTIWVTTPTNALEVVQCLEERKMDPQSLHLRTVMLSRPAKKETREQIAAGLLTAVKANFGVGEILDPGFCVECEAGHFHVHEDHFLVEVVDGELIVTTLCREAMPVLRYRTRVSGELRRDKCACGRTGIIFQPSRRLDQRICVNETPIYETQVAEVLARTRAAGRPFQVKVCERHILLSIEMSPELFSDTIWAIEYLQREVQSEFFTRLGIEAEVRFIGPAQKDSTPDKQG
jgi:phenylacetate-CoA ligase